MSCAASCASASRCSRLHRGDGMDDPAAAIRRSPGLAALARGERERALRPAKDVAVDRRPALEGHHQRPARRHLHGYQVTKGAAVWREERQGLGSRHRRHYRVERAEPPPGVGLELPAVLAPYQLVHQRACLKREPARERAHDTAHPRSADVPVLDRRIPVAMTVLEDARRPGGRGAGVPRHGHVSDERTAARGDELCTVVKGETSASAGREPAAETARAFEHRHRDVGARQLGRAGEARDAGADHRDLGLGAHSRPRSRLEMTQLRFELGALEFEVTDAAVQPSLIGLTEIRRGALRSVHAQVAVSRSSS